MPMLEWSKLDIAARPACTLREKGMFQNGRKVRVDVVQHAFNSFGGKLRVKGEAECH